LSVVSGTGPAAFSADAGFPQDPAIFAAIAVFRTARFRGDNRCLDEPEILEPVLFVSAPSALKTKRLSASGGLNATTGWAFVLVAFSSAHVSFLSSAGAFDSDLLRSTSDWETGEISGLCDPPAAANG